MTFDVRIGINPISWTNDDLPALGGETPLDILVRPAAIRVIAPAAKRGT